MRNLKYTVTRKPLQQTEVCPVSAKRTDDQTLWLDFGKAAFGTLLVMPGNFSDQGTLVVHLGEQLTAEGRLNRTPEGTIRYIRIEQELTRGSTPTRIVIPCDKRNTGMAAVKMPADIGQVFPFRYAEIESASIDPASIRQICVHYPFNDAASSFDSSSHVLNAVWDLKYKRNLDWNHAWGAAPANIIPRFVLGVRPLEAGFRKVLINPQPGSLERVSGTVPTLRGPVKVSLETCTSGERRLEVGIPANTEATIGLQSREEACGRVRVEWHLCCAQHKVPFASHDHVAAPIPCLRPWRRKTEWSGHREKQTLWRSICGRTSEPHCISPGRHWGGDDQPGRNRCAVTGFVAP